jgi:hypothetical protein
VSVFQAPPEVFPRRHGALFGNTSPDGWQPPPEEGRVACGHCSWSFTGAIPEGILRARDHRAEAHPELPVESPRHGSVWRKPKGKPSKPKVPKPPSLAERKRDAFRRAVAELLTEGVEMATAAEIAERMDVEATVSGVGIMCGASGADFERIGERRRASY